MHVSEDLRSEEYVHRYTRYICKKCMPLLTSFTMRCVKVSGGVLLDIDDRTQNLLTLALPGVFRATNGNLTFPNMKVLCLGLSTMAKDVTICSSNLVKLQLKMQCPAKLSLNAPSLQFIWFNFEVAEMMRLELKNTCSLQEVLYGASNFDTLVNRESEYRQSLPGYSLHIWLLVKMESGWEFWKLLLWSYPVLLNYTSVKSWVF